MTGASPNVPKSAAKAADDLEAARARVLAIEVARAVDRIERGTILPLPERIQRELAKAWRARNPQ